MSIDPEEFRQALDRLANWLERNDYRGYDPFDGLLSFLRPLTLYRKLPQQVLQQAVRRNPFNIRPLIGIRPHTSTKGMGYLAGGYLQMFQATGEERFRRKAEFCLTWLRENASKGYSGLCWGNSFDYISRGSNIPRGTPTVVWSGLIGHQFIEAFHLLKARTYLDDAISVGDHILRDLPRADFPGGLCISYVTDAQLCIHNSNLIGARHLAELYRATGRRDYLEIATDAVRYSARAQRGDGSWYYGEDPMYHWIDNWHTAYNLDAILGYELAAGSTEFRPVLEKGLDFYVQNFFRADGAPRYYWNRDYKFDIQSCSQSIDTLVLFGRTLKRPELISLAEKVARWTIANMQDPEGYFYLWKNRWFTNKTPTFHWGAATMFHAIAHLLNEGSQREY